MNQVPSAEPDVAATLATLAAQLLPDAAESGALHVVSTPIGHLGDVSIRALSVLQHAAVIYCEDTRTTRTLLARYGITTPTVALHEHNEARTVPLVLARLAAGDALALVSDAGTPLVSDPGQRLVDAVVAAGARIVPVPGASAVLGALVGAGLAAQPFTFWGFLPRKGGERRRALAAAASSAHTVVLYEAPSRVAATLDDLAEAAGAERPAVVARELTKRFEEFRRGTLADLAAYYSNTPPRGEIVIVLAGAPEVAQTEEALQAAADALRASGTSARDILKLLMSEHGAPRNLAYRLAHDPSSNRDMSGDTADDAADAPTSSREPVA